MGRIIQQVECGGSNTTQLQAIDDVEIHSQATLEVVVDLLAGSAVSGRSHRVMLVLEQGVVAVLELDRSNRSLTECVVHQVVDAFCWSSHHAAIYCHVGSNLQALVDVSLQVGTYIELVVVGILYQTVLVVVVDSQRVGNLVATALDAQVMVVEESILAQQGTQPVGVGIMIRVRTILEFLQGFLTVRLVQSVVSVCFVHQGCIVV